ncbi:hypothetical protein BCR36DRAFT_64257 [Piromyces finnis]|uniref:Uncharacterized protein n=1 Tax=Piromyces finnis TaxID=1754191 RepID=A0A1Y1UX73_9FUNG|nr:hypothetical protein BCR36DRAFT_161124 [Piromyces finnis]ORX49566.1 hypothetical protein BCR36DRAFT_64257 [Piromyces finnis]|eukprot:ORX42234.1 hypothetical protein BCR36DRAFT_161124 [Piromyces finnis]
MMKFQGYYQYTIYLLKVKFYILNFLVIYNNYYSTVHIINLLILFYFSLLFGTNYFVWLLYNSFSIYTYALLFYLYQKNILYIVHLHPSSIFHFCSFRDTF